MILLKATTETLALTTSSTADIDYSVSYADITTTTFSPSTSEGKIVTAATTTITAAPGASAQRQIKLITVTNRHASAVNTIIIKKVISAVEYILTPTATLLAGETMQYVDGQGWVYYSTSGAIKGNYAAVGADTQIQYSMNGTLAGDSTFTWNAVTEDLVLSGVDAGITLQGITNEPASPAAGQLQLYSKSVSGRMLPKWKAPSGVDTSFQSNLGFNTIWMWAPNTATTGVGTGFGTVWPTCTGTVTHPTVTSGMGTQIKVMQLTNVVTTTNQILGLTASTATLANVWRGSSVGLGGFFFQCRFKIMLVPATTVRLFVGLTSLTTGATAADTYTGDMCGFDHITTDGITTLSFVTRDNVTTNRATFTVPSLAAGNAYDATIYSQPGGSTISYRLVDILTGVTLVDTNTTTNIPRNTIFMGPQAQMSNGTANVTVTTVAIGINKLYLESDQ
jgi:hypothetical protein